MLKLETLLKTLGNAGVLSPFVLNTSGVSDVFAIVVSFASLVFKMLEDQSRDDLSIMQFSFLLLGYTRKRNNLVWAVGV